MAQSDARGTGAAIRNIMKWAQRPEWAALYAQVLDEHIGATLREFDLDSADALAKQIGDLAFGTSVYGPAFEDFITRDNGDGESIVDEYLRRRAYKESVPGRRYLEALGASVMSLYEILDAVPGSHLVLRDLVRGGEPVRVEERSGSRQAVKWDIIGARVVTHNRQQVLSGVILAFEPARAQALMTALRTGAQEMQQSLELRIAETASKPSVDESEPETEAAAFEQALRSMIREQSGSDDPDAIRRHVDGKFGGLTMNMLLYHTAPFFTRVWLEQTLDALLGPPPELRNYDGEPILHTETRWPIAADAAADLVQRLDSAESRHIFRSGPETQRWEWEGDKSLSRGPQAGAVRSGTSAADEELDLVSLGDIAIEQDALVLRTNSEGRAARGRALLEALLEGLLGAATVSHRDVVAEAWAQRNAGGLPRADDDEDAAEPAPGIPTEEKARILSEFKDRHYRSWLDLTIPALGGKTPRQAARADGDRDELVRLLKDLENHELRSARAGRMPAYDASWIWQELGLQADAA